jgi:hypothetical protein
VALAADTVRPVSRHLEPVPEPLPEDVPAFDAQAPRIRRWVALIVVIALVVATPFAYALYRLFH